MTPFSAGRDPESQEQTFTPNYGGWTPAPPPLFGHLDSPDCLSSSRDRTSDPEWTYAVNKTSVEAHLDTVSRGDSCTSCRGETCLVSLITLGVDLMAGSVGAEWWAEGRPNLYLGLGSIGSALRRVESDRQVRGLSPSLRPTPQPNMGSRRPRTRRPTVRETDLGGSESRDENGKGPLGRGGDSGWTQSTGRGVWRPACTPPMSGRGVDEGPLGVRVHRETRSRRSRDFTRTE